jgi:hypothetical protein
MIHQTHFLGKSHALITNFIIFSRKIDWVAEIFISYWKMMKNLRIYFLKATISFRDAIDLLNNKYKHKAMTPSLLKNGQKQFTSKEANEFETVRFAGQLKANSDWLNRDLENSITEQKTNHCRIFTLTFVSVELLLTSSLNGYYQTRKMLMKWLKKCIIAEKKKTSLWLLSREREFALQKPFWSWTRRIYSFLWVP